MKGIKENVKESSIDVVVTSPPYNIGINYNLYKDTLPKERYLSWINEIGFLIKTVLKEEGSFFLNIGNKPKDQWIAWDVANKLPEDSRLKLQALSLANDCYKYKMDLLTNAPVLSDAIKFVENCRDKLEAATPDISLKKVREDCITDKK